MKTRILALVVGILIGAYLGGYFTSETVYVYKERQTTQNFIRFVELFNETNMSVATINVPAVDESGNGVSTILVVQAVPGTGRAMVNIDKLLFWVDTQHSIRTARNVAENITGRDLLYYDLVYTIAANASVIEGPSAGAALTVATIAALEGKMVNSSVVMTGTVNHDGTVGPVGGIVEKAMAAKAVGSELVLVPLSQSEQVTYESVRHCEQVGFSQVCSIEQIPNTGL
jgi:predicted S18 family serine protease